MRCIPIYNQGLGAAREIDDGFKTSYNGYKPLMSYISALARETLQSPFRIRLSTAI